MIRWNRKPRWPCRITTLQQFGQLCKAAGISTILLKSSSASTIWKLANIGQTERRHAPAPFATLLRFEQYATYRERISSHPTRVWNQKAVFSIPNSFSLSSPICLRSKHRYLVQEMGFQTTKRIAVILAKHSCPDFELYCCTPTSHRERTAMPFS